MVRKLQTLPIVSCVTEHSTTDKHATDMCGRYIVRQLIS
jgi:hypothetical protein